MLNSKSLESNKRSKTLAMKTLRKSQFMEKSTEIASKAWTMSTSMMLTMTIKSLELETRRQEVSRP